jgi:fructokinase
MARSADRADLSTRSAAPARAAIGIDLGGTKIEALLLAEDGSECWRERVPTPAGDYDATLAAICGLVDRARAAAAAQAVRTGQPPPSIGIGGPGTLTATGRIENANSTCLNGRTLPADLEARLGGQVAYANDANCLALSEATDGAGAGAAVVFAAILGTGVGGGIAVHGRVLAGANGLAGEWGHNPLPWAGVEDPRLSCYCGRVGCIETLVSGPALAADHARRHGGERSAEDIARAAAAGDADAIATLERHADRLARALAAVIDLLDPDVVVVGGGLSSLPGLYEAVPARWSRWVFGTDRRTPLRTRFVPARHGPASGVRGAAWLGRSAADERRAAARR